MSMSADADWQNPSNANEASWGTMRGDGGRAGIARSSLEDANPDYMTQMPSNTHQSTSAAPDTAADSSPHLSTPPVIPRKRGRPRGSLNKATILAMRSRQNGDEYQGDNEPMSDEPPAKRGRGRPKGSKNKPKLGHEVPSFSFSSTPTHNTRSHQAGQQADSDPEEEEVDALIPSDSVHQGPTAGQSHSQDTLSRSQPIAIPPTFTPENGSGSSPIPSPIPLSSSFSIESFLVASLDDTDYTTQSIPTNILNLFHKYRETYLKPDLGSDTPRLYSALHSFWIPQESSLFDRSTHPAINLYQVLRFFLWDPFPLVPGGMNCPNQGCSAKLQRYVDSYNLRKIVDLNNSYWIIGTRYQCTTCGSMGQADRQWRFISWEPSIITSIPPEMSREFPLHLTSRGGVDKTLFALMQTCFTHGLGVKYFADAIRTHHSRNSSAGVAPVMQLPSANSPSIPHRSPRTAQNPPPKTTNPPEPQIIVHQQMQAGPSTDNRTANDPVPSISQAVTSGTIPAPLIQGSPITHVSPQMTTRKFIPPQPATTNYSPRFSTSVITPQSQHPPQSWNSITYLHPNTSTTPQLPNPGANVSAASPGAGPSSAVPQLVTQPHVATPLPPLYQVFDTGPPERSQSSTGRTSTRKPRTCRKCGRMGISASPEGQGCAGASDVKSCKYPCRDCGMYDCEGRDTKKWQAKTPCANYLARQANSQNPYAASGDLQSR